MNCSQVKQRIPQWMDGELEAGEAKAVAAHVGECTDCRSEADFWRELGTALREDFGDIKAPPGFASGVMAHLAGQQKNGWGRILYGWKRSLAVAATFLLVALGSASAYWHMGGNFAGQVATSDVSQAGQVTNKEPLPEPNHDNNTDKPGILPADQDDNNDNDGSRNQSDTGEQENNIPEQGNTEQQPAGNDNNRPGTVQTGEDTLPRGESTEQYAFLSTGQDRFVERTLVRVKVEDINTAHNQALSTVNNYGAHYEVLGAESTPGSGQETLKVVVDNTLSGELQGEFAKLGQVISTDTQRDDLTGRYNEKVEQYRSLEAQLQDAGTPVERNQLQIKMAAIKEELKSWDRESRTGTIILWLEN